MFKVTQWVNSRCRICIRTAWPHSPPLGTLECWFYSPRTCQKGVHNNSFIESLLFAGPMLVQRANSRKAGLNWAWGKQNEPAGTRTVLRPPHAQSSLQWCCSVQCSSFMYFEIVIDRWILVEVQGSFLYFCVNYYLKLLHLDFPFVLRWEFWYHENLTHHMLVLTLESSYSEVHLFLQSHIQTLYETKEYEV